MNRLPAHALHRRSLPIGSAVCESLAFVRLCVACAPFVRIVCANTRSPSLTDALASEVGVHG